MDQTLHRLAETFGIVTPIARQRTLPPPLRQLHRHILRHFAQHATAPEPQRLREWAHQLDIELDAALDQLIAVDLVEADPATARVLGAYPFSAIPRGHKVQLAGGPTVESYCAIDALGIPAMLDRDVVISSRDPDIGEPIRITVINGQASWRPDKTVVVVGSDRSCGPSACCRCPFITFHSSPATAAGHLQAADLAGEILTQPQALAAGALLFGDVPRPVLGHRHLGIRWPDHRSSPGCGLIRGRPQGVEHALARSTTPLGNKEEPGDRFARVPGGSCIGSPGRQHT